MKVERLVFALLLAAVVCTTGVRAAEAEADMEMEAEAESDLAIQAEVEAEVDAILAADAEAEAEAQAEAELGAATCLTVNGLEMIKSFEGFREAMYKDVAGIPTIGYGTLCSSGLLPCNRKVTRDEAARALGSDVVKRFAPCVTAAVKYPGLSSQQFSALVSFAYNVGCGALQSVVTKSKLNTAAPNLKMVSSYMREYNKARVNGRLQVVQGLVNRRNAEGAMFDKGTPSACAQLTATAARPTLQASAARPTLQATATCASLRGVCKDKAQCTGANTPRAGLCPGTAASVQCCVPNAPAVTPVTPPVVPVTPVPTTANCMTVDGVNLIKSFEGFYPKMYKDVAGIPTIGYGILCSDKVIDCASTVTEPEAAAVLGSELMKKYAPCVRNTVKAPLNNQQFSALVSFAFNAGCGALGNVAAATGLTTNKPVYANVPARMKLYNKARVRGVLTVISGLVRRRAAEAALFQSSKVSPCMPAPTIRPTLQATVSTAAASPAASCLNGEGLALIKSFEGFRANVYRDSAGIPTIGYGTLCSSKLIPCTKPTTEAIAAGVLGADVSKRFAPCVQKAVKVPLNTNQYSALVSFAYNAGCGALQNVVSATGLGTPGKANFKAVAGRMALYNKARVKGVLTVISGLVRRRAAEGALFNKAAVTTPCAVRPTLQSSSSAASARALKAPSKKKVVRRLHSTIYGSLTRGNVDLPSGTEMYIPLARGTTLPIRIKADIAADVVSHEPKWRKDRGPLGRLKKNNKKKF